ncbi:hypothetical protein ACVNF4_22110, partial [Streptomyces sp. S6]
MSSEAAGASANPTGADALGTASTGNPDTAGTEPAADTGSTPTDPDALGTASTGNPDAAGTEPAADAGSASADPVADALGTASTGAPDTASSPPAPFGLPGMLGTTGASVRIRVLADSRPPPVAPSVFTDGITSVPTSFAAAPEPATGTAGATEADGAAPTAGTAGAGPKPPAGAEACPAGA